MKPPPMRAGQQGFTLLETLIVLAIAAVILAVVIAAKPRAAAFRLSAEARTIVSGLRARHLAALTGAVETRFALDPVSRSFDGSDKRETLPPDMGVAILAAGPEGRDSAGQIRFFPDGRSSGGAITLSLDGRQARIDVDWLTGEAWVH